MPASTIDNGGTQDIDRDVRMSLFVGLCCVPVYDDLPISVAGIVADSPRGTVEMSKWKRL